MPVQDCVEPNRTFKRAKKSGARPSRRTPLGAVNGNVRRGTTTSAAGAKKRTKKKTETMVKKTQAMTAMTAMTAVTTTATSTAAATHKTHPGSARGGGVFEPVSDNLGGGQRKLNRGNESKRFRAGAIAGVSTKRKIMYCGADDATGTYRVGTLDSAPPRAPSAQLHQPQMPGAVQPPADPMVFAALPDVIVESSPSSAAEDPMVCAKRLHTYLGSGNLCLVGLVAIPVLFVPRMKIITQPF